MNEFNNEEIDLSNMNIEHDNLLFQAKIINNCSYDDPNDFMYLISLIMRGSHLFLPMFFKIPVMYAFIIPLSTDTNNIIINFGFTRDIIKIIKYLESRYGSNIYLIGLCSMELESSEKEFHDLIINFYPETVLKGKRCSYILNTGIMTQFDYLDKKNNASLNHKNKYELTQEEIDIMANIKKQHVIFFINHKDKFKNINLCTLFEMDYGIMMKHDDIVTHYKEITIKSKEMESTKNLIE